MSQESTGTAPSIRRPLAWIAVVAAALLLPGCGSGDAPAREEAPPEEGRVALTPEQVATAEVGVAPVHLEEVSGAQQIPAMLASPDTASVTIGSVVEGRVASVLVLPGDRVQEGEALLRIHSHELTDALRDLTSSEARLDYVAAAADRSDQLFAAGAVSREEVERRTAERVQIEAEVERARDWVGHLSPSPDGLVVVRASRTGTVFSVAVVDGTVVLPGMELVSLGRTDVLWATGWVPERLDTVVRPGDSVEVSVDGLSIPPLEAHVVQVGGAVDLTRRAIAVRVELRSVPPTVRPGMFATLTLPTGPAELRAVLPSDAVQQVEGGEVAFVEESPGLYVAVPVVSVPLVGGRVGVSGLAEGQRVVVTGAYAIRSVMEGNVPAGGAS